MSSTESEGLARLRARNIGGIDETEVSLQPGVTVLSGRNATNRTSFLQALMAVLGSRDVSLKGDADEGFVELDLEGDRFTRTLERKNDTIVTRGDPYLDDPELADLFAFLLESNEARRAVARGDDLRELIMRPVDTEAIKADIERLEAEKRDLDTELEALDSLEAELPQLEQERTQLEAELEEKASELEAKRAELETVDVEETREEKAELDEKLDELSDARSRLETIEFRIDTEQETIETLEAELEDLEAELEALPEQPAADSADIEDRIDRLRERRRKLDSSVKELQSVIQFNEEMLEGTSSDIAEALRGDEQSQSVTDQLVSDRSVVCWTCGSEVDSEQIEATLDRLRELRQTKLEDRSSLRTELDELKQERQELEQTARKRRDLERRLERTEADVEDSKTTIADLEDERDDLEARIETLETAVENLEQENFSEILDLHREVNQLEFEHEQTQRELDSVESDIEDVETRLEERDHLEAQRDELRDELEDLRTRIDRIEADAIEQFNDHMNEVLDILDYANLERIWIERVERQVREGRRKVTKSVFELHVIRTSESGATYEDTVDHLSESEREVTGLLFALSGYLVHEVHEVMPFVLLDSLEAIDSERIADLVDYLATYANYLVVALLPEDAAAVSDDHPRITDI